MIYLDLRKEVLFVFLFKGVDVCSILGAFGAQGQDWRLK
jgi:hypothetical protein